MKLPDQIQAYFDGKNARDPNLALSGFAAGAIVGDEARKHRGHQEIAAWMAETSKKYNELSEPLESREEPDAIVVVAKVRGTFPGSPAKLRYRFTFAGDSIQTLEIGS